MATERLIVKNFGPIQEADLDLRKVTVLIGEQASGKSVLAKLVATFGEVLLNKEALQSILNYFEINTFIKPDSEVEYSNQAYRHHYQRNDLAKSFSDKYLEELFFDYVRTESAIREMLIPATVRSEEGRAKLRELREKNSQLRKELRVLTQLYEYILAERVIISTLAKSLFQIIDRNISLPRFLTNFASEFEIAREQYSKIYLPPLGITYLFENNQNKVRLKTGEKIDMELSASGFQSLIPLLLVVENRSNLDNQVFIIEEPELNLYPTTQKKLVEYLIEKCTKGDNRLIVTTHSPYILTALNNCIEANNVLKSNPEAKDKVNKLVPPESQIAYEDVAAYFVANGTAKSIMNEGYQMIDANALDDVSEELARVYDSLLDLKYQPQD